VVVSAGNPIRLYVNGTEYVGTDMAGHSPKNILAAPAGLRNAFVGRSAFEGNSDQIFNGFIDDVVIFDTALSAAQVAALSAHNFVPAAAAPTPPPPAAAATTTPPAQTAAPSAGGPVGTFDPITLIALGAIAAGAGAVIVKKRK
jgi:hypothetical protein